jgi:hypothetical protein
MELVGLHESGGERDVLIGWIKRGKPGTRCHLPELISPTTSLTLLQNIRKGRGRKLEISSQHHQNVVFRSTANVF